MHSVTLLAVLVAMVAAVAMAADTMVKVDQISVNIMEKSGAMTLTATEMEKEDDDDDDTDSGEDADVVTTVETVAAETTTTTTVAPDGGRKRRAADDMKTNIVEVMFMSLMEVDAEGNKVGDAKASSQALDNSAFEDLMFTFDAKVEDSEIPNSKNKADTMIKALEQSYHGALAGSGMMKVFVYIAKEDGNITLGAAAAEEVTPVMKGQVKFSVHLEGWVWCTEAAANCMKGEVKEVGAALDMEINVKGNGDAEKADTADGMAMTFEIGNDNHLFVSKKVKKTNTDDTSSWVDLAENYPMTAKASDDTTKLTVRLPMFEKSVLYDPSIRLMVPGSDDTSASNAVVASMGVMVAALLAAFMRL